MSDDIAPLRCDGPGCAAVLRVALLDPPMDWITLRWCWPNMAVGTYTAWFCSLGCLDAKVRVWRDDGQEGWRDGKRDNGDETPAGGETPKALWTYFNSLRDQGFTRDEAMALTRDYFACMVK